MQRIVHALIFLVIVTGVIQLALTIPKPPLSKEVPTPTSVTKAKVFLKRPPQSYVLPQSQFVAQSFNNCGPATLSMTLSMFGKYVSQEELAQEMRPFNNPFGGVDDKSIFAREFATYARKYGFESLHRPNGTIDLLKTFVANDIPVVVRTLLNPYEDIGHFRIVRGYDSAKPGTVQNPAKQNIIVDDSYNGPGIEIAYSDFLSMWQPFQYGYILVFPKEKQDVVNSILDKEEDETVAWQSALERAEKELKQNPNNTYAQFNIAIAQYHLGSYENAVVSFEKAEPNLPPRMLWYQYEPVLAYQKMKNYDRVFQLTDAILQNGNLAFSELYQVRGEVYKVLGNTEAAKQEFENAVYYNHNFLTAKKALENMN
ncbi:MAG: C39 family peptidase [Candidatus Levybacteria bacterium]|nr:C39 family peptidase [Candidatus Levybacteria bacterium]